VDVVASVSAVRQQFTAATPNPLLVQYKFAAAPVEDVVVDSGPLGNDGTNYGSTWKNNGLLGGVQSFDGVDDRVEAASAIGLLANGSFTVACWVGQSVVNEGCYCYGFGRNDDNTPILGLQFQSGIPVFYLRDGLGMGIALNGVASVLDGLPHHVMFVKNGTAMTLYVDNVLVDSDTGDYAATLFNVYGLGCLTRTTPVAHWAGVLDDFRIYNRALTAAERLSVYNGNDI
jgi:hypothetical protein